MNKEAQLWYEWLDATHQGNIRYCYEEMLINTWRYSRQTVENTDDGRDEYIEETYLETDAYLEWAFDRARDDALTENE